jgi:hypothetical protein
MNDEFGNFDYEILRSMNVLQTIDAISAFRIKNNIFKPIKLLFVKAEISA